MPRNSKARKPQTAQQQKANTPTRGGVVKEIKKHDRVNDAKKGGATRPGLVRRVAPASIRQETDAAAKAASSGVATMPTTGDAKIVHESPSVETVGIVSKAKLDILAFMEEPVRIIIHETSEPNADPRFEVSVNGQTKVFVRGQEYTVPRKFVEGLARAKPMSFNNEEYFKQDGSRSVRWPSKSGLRYPFSVLEDPNPRGRDWLSSVARQR